MDAPNVDYNPHCLQGPFVQPGLERNATKEANLHHTSSMAPDQINQRQGLAENYYTPCRHPAIGNETNDIGLMPKNVSDFTMDPHKTTFEPTAADLDPSIYYAHGPSPNGPNLFLGQLPLDSRPKRQNSGGGDDQHGGKRRRSGQHNNSDNDNSNNDNNDSNGNNGNNDTGPERDGVNGGSGSNNGNDGRGTDEAPNPTGDTPSQFVCLFCWLVPEKFKECANLDLKTWSRVFQHIKRTHLLVRDHCPTCRQSFDGKDGEAMKNLHNRSGPCQRAGIIQSGRLLQEEYDKIKNIRAASDEERWKLAWGKLFPDLETPSAFAKTYREFVLRNIQASFLKYLQKAQGHPDLESLADELVAEVTRTPIPAARAVDSGQALEASQVPQAPSSCPASMIDANPSWALNTSGQTAEVPPGLMMMLPNEQPPLGQPQQVPFDLPTQVDNHSGMSAPELFDPDAYEPSAQDFPEVNPPPIPSEQAPGMPNPDLTDSLQGVGANFPPLFIDDFHMADEWWPFPSPQPDPGNQGSDDHS